MVLGSWEEKNQPPLEKAMSAGGQPDFSKSSKVKETLRGMDEDSDFANEGL